MNVDVQSHVFPQAYAELLVDASGSVTAERAGPSRYRLRYGDTQVFMLDLEDYAPERKLAAMDAAGIDISVLSVNIPSPSRLPPEQRLAGARICNEYLADLVRSSGGRFAAIASLPLPDVDASVAELRRAVHHLDLRGVFLCSHLDGVNLDDPGLEPFYAAVADLQVPLVLHPTVPTWGGHVKDHSMIPMAAFMVDTTFAMLRLILGGVMERHPALQVVHPHVGGVLPYLMGRVQEQTEVKRRGRDHISQPPASYYERVWLDLVTPSAQAMRYALEFAGPARLMFGSDHPWVSIEVIQDYMREGLELPEEQMAAIRGGNAASLFGLGMPKAKTSLPDGNPECS